MQIRKNKGFSLVEVLVTAAIVSTVTITLLRLFVFCAALSEMGGNLTAAMVSAQDKMEEIKNYNYDLIAADYVAGGAVGDTFSATSPTRSGVIYVDSSNTSLLRIEIDVSWRNKDGRVVGEDADLDGVLDIGEDLNSDGKLTSTARIITNIAQR